eukprot:4934284-Alexandrium_andersonii.AAC.1
MSASLVGSEMCIRDSPSPALPRAAAPRVQLRRGTKNSPVQNFRYEPCAPVSYTHLTLPTICSV